MTPEGAGDRAGVADLELAGAFDVERLDDAVHHQHRIALRTHAHAIGGEVERQADGLREGGGAVAQHAHLAGRPLVARPGAHHEGVVDGHAPDLVHAGGLEGVELRDVARHVLGRAGGREGARQREQRDRLAGAGGGHVDVVGAQRAALGLDLDEFLQGARGQLVANLDRHVSLLVLKAPMRRRK
jgi:hypothetical protein